MHSLLYPMFFHVIWVMLLYVALTLVRAPRVWSIGRRFEHCSSIEPRVSANLSNQFEWPIFFYIVCVLLLDQEKIPEYQLWLAWLFILGRVLHSMVQILINHIRLRGLVFTINFSAVMGMWWGLMFDTVFA